MLIATISMFIAFFAGSIGILSLMRITINGIIPSETTETISCINQLKSTLGEYYNNLTIILDKNFQSINPKINRVYLMKKNFHTIIFATLINTIYFGLFYHAAVTMVIRNNIAMDIAFSQLQYVAYAGFLISAYTIGFGWKTIVMVDELEEFQKMALYKEFKKIKGKLNNEN